MIVSIEPLNFLLVQSGLCVQIPHCLFITKVLFTLKDVCENIPAG